MTQELIHAEPANGDHLPASADQAAMLLDVISRAASDPTIDIDKMERLLAMAERVEAQKAEREFNAAMALAQGEMPRIEALGRNSQTNSNFARYPDIDRIVRPIYTRHGFSVTFGTRPSDDPAILIVTARVAHRAGHSERYELAVPADGKGAKGNDVMTKVHATGSATTYGQRYLAKMIWNLAIGNDPDDDDGNAADGYVPINGIQLVALRDAMKAAGRDSAQVFRAIGMDEATPLEDFPLAAFDRMVSALNNMARKKEAARGTAK